MSKIISIHSFRGGTGKSNTTANLASLLAATGRRVGVIDTDIQSPGIHVLFGLTADTIAHSLNDYLWGRCAIGEASHDVTARVNPPPPGRVMLIPASLQSGEIVSVLREGYDVSLLTIGFRTLITELALDVLLIDTHPGLNEETLFAIAISHTLVIILRPDQQDYEGTGVTLEVARSLEVPRTLVIVNNTPPAFDAAAIRTKVEQAYACEVAAVLPHAEEMMTLASNGLFVLRYPDHPLTALLKEVADQLDA